MAKRIVFLYVLLVASAFAQAAPTVWEQLQNGEGPASSGVVKSVDIVGSDIYFRTESRDAFGDLQVHNDRLCRSADGSEDLRESEEVRATILKSRIDLLQEARRNGKPIQFGSRGPWKSCINFLRILEG